jgi:hypothetical protein
MELRSRVSCGATIRKNDNFFNLSVNCDTFSRTVANIIYSKKCDCLMQLLLAIYWCTHIRTPFEKQIRNLNNHSLNDKFILHE